MIGPDGLLLVVPHLLAVPVSIFQVGLQTSKYLNLDMKYVFAVSHISSPRHVLSVFIRAAEIQEHTRHCEAWQAKGKEALT
jgi:hypothetical protein